MGERLPDLGEAAYARKCFPRFSAMRPAGSCCSRISSCALEAVAIGKLAAYLYPRWIAISCTASPASRFFARVALVQGDALSRVSEFQRDSRERFVQKWITSAVLSYLP